MEMTPLTSEKIAELERLLGAATTGPWELHECVSECRDTYLNMTGGASFSSICSNDPWGDNATPDWPDMRLMVAAVNALPALLSLAKRVAVAPVARVEVTDELFEIVPSSGGAYVGIEKMDGKRVALVEIVGGEE
jgi:hypothetical protein